MMGGGAIVGMARGSDWGRLRVYSAPLGGVDACGRGGHGLPCRGPAAHHRYGSECASPPRVSEPAFG